MKSLTALSTRKEVIRFSNALVELVLKLEDVLISVIIQDKFGMENEVRTNTGSGVNL